MLIRSLAFVQGGSEALLKIVKSNMKPINGKIEHFVFKVGNRKATMMFYREILGMKVLRHEEFDKGCEAACNGPYDNLWSKTMVGYGPEKTHFNIELTHNYPIKAYKMGNDFKGVTIKDKEILERAKANKWPIASGNVVESPDGHKFHIINEPQPTDKDPIQKVTLSSSNLQKTIEYWNGLLGLQVSNKTDKSVEFAFDPDQPKLEFQQIDQPIDRAEAFGRVAFSCPHLQQEDINEKIQKAATTVLIPLTSLDTPGKATVRVIILADPDGHEICFVDSEAYRQLSVPVPADEQLLNEMIESYEKAPAKYKV